MKTLTVEKNRIFVHHELSGRTCADILKTSQKMLRFDLRYLDEDENIDTWRISVKSADEIPTLEIRDYKTGERKVFPLEQDATLQDASLLALKYVWALIEGQPVTEYDADDDEYYDYFS
ncbi:MAG: hypothetical protein H9W81_12315 [Enterococcus sp.]|nr:hypothetical protein [Enterococcus sp.]